ncbi:cytochrome P450 2J6 isoform X1 [Xenopus tropicalis]|uniref:Cytochrome P450 2J6 isoform X1 n=1 Tax=Xenopus tropicalis TaxID=8364 RepID=F7BIJ8_XENTR|nr:cytochrome P450 2J6 isoform X1 [Xenopus tropicalis]
MELGIALLLGLVILVIFCCKKQQPVGFPPGPAAMPVLGNILQMDFSNPLKDLQKFSEVYGPVYSIYLGFTPAVVVRGLKSIKEVLVNKGTDFAGRPQNRITDVISKSKGLVVAPYGQAWKEHRRFTLSTLRSFGLGKKSMEDRIQEENMHLIQAFKNSKDVLFDPHFVLENAVSNIICSIVFGRRYDYNDTSFQNILNLVHENMKLATGFWAQLYNAFGFIQFLPLPHKKIFQNVDVVFAFLGKVVEEHKETLLPGEPRDYIDCYLEELKKKQEEDGNKMTFDEENLFSCVADLFVAGTETTTSSLEWCLLYMLKFPEIQEKCHEEIDRVFGNKNCLEYEDRERMPYTQAVLQEVQRHASVVPLGVSHSPIRDVHLNGFFIPKGTVIITDLSSVHYDKTHWKYPHEFNPENFLNENGELIKTEAFLPFSAGPRVCLGENLARMEIFLFFTAMLQHFEFHWPDPTSPPDLRPVFGLSQAPKHYKMRIVSRKKK